MSSLEGGVGLMPSTGTPPDLRRWGSCNCNFVFLSVVWNGEGDTMPEDTMRRRGPIVGLVDEVIAEFR